jgi:hypothetical protein
MFTRRKRILLVGTLLTIGVCWAWFREDAPKYHGRTLTQWFAASRLEERSPRPSENEYRDALRALGTNDLPGVVRRISFDPNHCTAQRLIRILPESATPRRVQEYLYDQKCRLDIEATVAIEVFQALGPQGAPAIPELTKVAISGAQAPAYRAVDCLGLIGEQAVPALIMVATNPQPQNFRAFRWLVAFTNSPEAMRIVAQNARDPRFEDLVGVARTAAVTATPAQ